MVEADRLPSRSEVAPGDTWDLASLFADDAAWEAAFAEYESKIGGYSNFAGKLGDGAGVLADCLAFDTTMDRLADRIGTYAFLKTTEDVANSTYQGLKARYIGAASKAGELASFIRPELLSLPAEQLAAYVNAPELAAFKLSLERVIR